MDPPRPPRADDPRPPAARIVTAMDRNSAHRRAIRDIPRSCRLPPCPRRREETADRIGESPPACAPLFQRAIAAPGQGVDPPPSAGLGGHPAAFKQARLLETMQH